MSDFPYPGLRPFQRDEADIFFGREQHTDELLKRLDTSRFLSRSRSFCREMPHRCYWANKPRHPASRICEHAWVWTALRWFVILTG